MVGEIEEIWEGATVSVSGRSVTRNIPALPVIANRMTAYVGAAEIVAVTMAQLQTTTDKTVVVELVASCVASVLKVTTRTFADAFDVVPATGFDYLDTDENKPDEPIVTNIAGISPMKRSDLGDLPAADTSELGALVGIYLYAIGKKPTEENITAFGARRRNAALSTVIGEPVVFVDNSPHLTLKVMRKVHGSFAAYAAHRARLINAVAIASAEHVSGGAVSLFQMFGLLNDQGMAGLNMVREALMKWEWIRTEFPELRPEVEAANAGFKLIRAAPPATRPFLKVIHGDRFVPTHYQDIKRLMGMAKYLLLEAHDTLSNFSGGAMPEEWREKVDRLRAGRVAVV